MGSSTSLRATITAGGAARILLFRHLLLRGGQCLNDATWSTLFVLTYLHIRRGTAPVWLRRYAISAAKLE